MSDFAPIMLGSLVAMAIGSTEAAPYFEKRAAKEEDQNAEGTHTQHNDNTSKKTSNEKTVQKAEATTEPHFANKPTETDKETKSTKEPKETKDAATTTKQAPKETTKASAETTSQKPSSSAAPAKTVAKTSEASATSLSSSSSASAASSTLSTPTSTMASISSSSKPSSLSSAISSPSITNSAALADKANGESTGMSSGAIGGIIAAILIIVIGACSFIALRRRQERKRRHMNSKPDPFTMGFGSDSAFNGGYQPPMQQVDQYQHQYGTQPAMTENISTEPSAPQYQQNTPYQQNLTSGTNATLNNDAAITSAAGAAVTAAAVGSAVAFNENAASSQSPLAPTQPDSLGVYYVAATYTPTLSDEIDIQTGDQVEILVEYDDGWCQGINLSRGNVKGVFPKHCIDYTPPDQLAPLAAPSALNSNPEVDRTKRVSSMFMG